MTDIVISSKEKEEEKKPDTEDIKEILKRADTYEKLKKINDDIEAEYKRSEELIRSKGIIGGRAEAGKFVPELTDKEKADIEAKEILAMFR